MDTLLAAARRIQEAGIPVEDLGLRRPSLDDVFLTLTGSDDSNHANPPSLALTRQERGHQGQAVA
jgi:hypothetical protein